MQMTEPGTKLLRRIRLVGVALVAVAAVLLIAGIFAQGSPAHGAEPASNSGLKIYFIDVEGGQSTLIILPSHQSLLIDTGFAGTGADGYHPGNPKQARDANRIVAAARDAGISKIDYLLLTHFHSDHDGGLKELSQLLPIGALIDHGKPGPGAEKENQETADAFKDYLLVRPGRGHIEPRPGDRLPLQGVEATVVSSDGITITAPLAAAGAPNHACGREADPPLDTLENPRSTGILLRYGKFRFLDLGDLSGKPLFDLSCPKSLIGHVDAYLVPHHGGADGDVPATFAAFSPRVAIMNNSATKGGAQLTYKDLHAVAKTEDVWQLHRSTAAGESNFAASRIANLDDATSYWIEMVAQADGSFQVFNARTGNGTRYAAQHP